jgi:CxC3 like cysteine cluster associated with KDZ transposases
MCLEAHHTCHQDRSALKFLPPLIVPHKCVNVVTCSGRYDVWRVAFHCRCPGGACPPVWQSVADLHALGYFPCSKDLHQAETFAHESVFRCWRNKLVCNPSGSFQGFVKELDACSREHACVRTMLLVLLSGLSEVAENLAAAGFEDPFSDSPRWLPAVEDPAVSDGCDVLSAAPRVSRLCHGAVVCCS